MALPSAIKLFINPRTGLAFGNFSGTSQITNPVVTLGDTARFEIYLVEDTGINSFPRQEISWPGSPGIKVAVGPIDESPQAGTWSVSFGGDTTSALPFNVTAAALGIALNALASITSAGGVTVSKIGDNYNIVFNQNGARGDITTNGASLIPLSVASVSALQIGDVNRPQIALIHVQRTVAGLATSFAATPTSAITVQSLAAWNGTRAAYRVSVSPDPKGGSFSLAFDAATGTDVSSASIAVGASALDVENALAVGALAAGKVSVTQVAAFAYDITVTAEPGTNGLTANGSGLISFTGYAGELSLNTAEAISLLDGANQVQTNLEVEITSDSKTLTILQIPCTLNNSVIDAASVTPLVLDTYLSQNVADGRYTRQANNLSDLDSAATARTNLGVYSTGAVDTALALKANLAGATFSGKINTAVTDTTAALNIAPQAAAPSSTIAGDIWIATNINFRDVNGTSKAVANTNTSNTYTAPQIIQTNVGTVNAALRVTQLGTGNAIEVEDSTTPDSTRFVVDQHGKVGIGVIPDATAALKVDTNGIMFGDGTTQITAAASPDLSGYALKSGATFTGKVNLTTTATTAGLNILPQAVAPTTQVPGDVWIGNFNIFYKDLAGTFRSVPALNTVNQYTNRQAITVNSTSSAFSINQTGTGSALVVEDSATPDSDALIVDANGNLGIGVSNNPGSIWTGSSYKLEVHGSALVTGNLQIDGVVNGTLTVPYQIIVGDSISGDTAIIVQTVITFPNVGGALGGFTTQTNAMGSTGSIGYGDYPSEIVINLNGQSWAVPARQIV
jgi:hypothetical protein